MDAYLEKKLKEEGIDEWHKICETAIATYKGQACYQKEMLPNKNVILVVTGKDGNPTEVEVTPAEMAADYKNTATENEFPL